MSSMSRMNRRTFFTVSGIGLATVAVGASAVLAQDSTTTPKAGEGTPGATPGASPSASPMASGEAIKVEGLDTLKFEPSSFTVAPGQTIHFINSGVLEHDLNVDELDMKMDPIGGGKTEDLKVPEDAKPGEYTFYCSVPGHRAAGMEGKMTVK